MKLYVKSMVSLRCKMLVKEALRKLGLHFIIIDFGEIEIMEELTLAELESFNKMLHRSGLELIDNKKAILVDKVKNVIIEMIHYTDELPKNNYSDFISMKLCHDYTYLANIFSEMKGITIQQFIIRHKVEKIKELLMYDELNLTEISYKMHYSSVAHLSNQFKKVTGMTPTYFKNLKANNRTQIEEVGS